MDGDERPRRQLGSCQLRAVVTQARRVNRERDEQANPWVAH